jgi:hypothetical protein
MKSIAFLSLSATSSLAQRCPRLIVKSAIDPRSVYDVATGFTYAVFWGANYWTYPDKSKRPDVEVLAAMLALLWHIFCTFDTSVYGYLWGVGGASQLYSRMMVGRDDISSASSVFVGVHLCGQIALLLLLMDVLSKR